MTRALWRLDNGCYVIVTVLRGNTSIGTLVLFDGNAHFARTNDLVPCIEGFFQMSMMISLPGGKA